MEQNAHPITNLSLSLSLPPIEQFAFPFHSTLQGPKSGKERRIRAKIVEKQKRENRVTHTGGGATSQQRLADLSIVTLSGVSFSYPPMATPSLQRSAGKLVRR